MSIKYNVENGGSHRSYKSVFFMSLICSVVCVSMCSNYMSCHYFSLCCSKVLVDRDTESVISHLHAFAGVSQAFFTWLTFAGPSRFRGSHNSSRKPSGNARSWAQSPSHRSLLFFIHYHFNDCHCECLPYHFHVL